MSSSPACKGYIIVHAISKRRNIGQLFRSCVAFGTTDIIVVGKRKRNRINDFLQFYGAQGTQRFVTCHIVPSMDCIKKLMGKNSVVIGVEIHPGAIDVTDHQRAFGKHLVTVDKQSDSYISPMSPVKSSTQIIVDTTPEPSQLIPVPSLSSTSSFSPFPDAIGFLFGNEGEGLTADEIHFCDRLVYIPQYGQGTASLNVMVSASIVLHHFALATGKQKAQIDPHDSSKYKVEHPGIRKDAVRRYKVDTQGQLVIELTRNGEEEEGDEGDGEREGEVGQMQEAHQVDLFPN